jgi:hypothetical protein
MQPGDKNLVASFENLRAEILKGSVDYAEKQIFLQKYLRKHPEVGSPRFRAMYLQNSFEMLIKELIRTCLVTEENILLLGDLAHEFDLDSLYKRHYDLIKRKQDPNYTGSAIDHQGLSFYCGFEIMCEFLLDKYEYYIYFSY